VLAWKPAELIADDRAPVLGELSVGRSSSCRWCVRDERLSRRHFSLTPLGSDPERFCLVDCGSRNGTHLGGQRVTSPVEVGPGAVIRAGGCVFVVVASLDDLAPPSADQGSSEMAGAFWAAELDRRLRVAARTGRHILLSGESGTGKEIAARRLHQLYSEPAGGRPYVVHNAACFAGEDDAVSHLFGVVRGAFTGVEPRTGALELAQGGTLFLDEAHALPLRVQRSLLRFVEDGLVQPLGHGAPVKQRSLSVRLVLSTNLPIERACEEGQLAHDLVARLHVVVIPALRERRADIPAIFRHIIGSALAPPAAAAVTAALTAPVLERLCLHDFRRGNVRELVDLVALVGAQIDEGMPPEEALSTALDQLIPEIPAAPPQPLGAVHDPGNSFYEQHRRTIIAAFEAAGGNLSKTEQALKAEGVHCTRRWLAEFLDTWGVRPINRRR